MEMSKEETIEYEEVTIKVPKLVMDYLRRIYGNAIKHLEYAVVDHVRADIEAIDHERITDLFSLAPVFKTVLR